VFDYEQVQIQRGARSGFPIIAAIHSTALGPAVGGCRLWRYPDWRDGLTDALRLARGMTLKNAAAKLAHGGGKTVIALPLGTVLDDATRRDVLLDVGELVESFAGQYATGPDVGTSTEDMGVIGEVTKQVFCRPEPLGGSGDPAAYTAAGVRAAIDAVCRLLDTPPDGTDTPLDGTDSTDSTVRRTDSTDSTVRGRTVTVIGLGHVGAHLARDLARDGAQLLVTDIDERRRDFAAEIGATWCEPGAALTAEADLLVPAALGGQLTAEVVPALRCRAIVGPANNQLADDGVARLLHGRGIHWVPDYLASAGGVTYAVARELHGAGLDEARHQVLGIGAVTEELLRTADRLGTDPHQAALHRVREQLAARS
jgi:glutamate dehydrogenase/leucine dehydrogenase